MMNFKKIKLGLLESFGLIVGLLLFASFLWDWRVGQAQGEKSVRKRAQVLAVATKAKLDKIEESTNAFLAAWGEAYRQGVITPDNWQLLNPLLQGPMKTFPFITSVNIGTSRGEGYLLLREGQKWKNRLKKADEQGVVTWQELDSQGARKTMEVRRDDYDPRRRPWYEQVQDREAVVWSAPYVFLTTKDPGITASRRFVNPAGETAVMGVDIMLRDLALILADAVQEEPPGTAAFLLDDQGGLIATSAWSSFTAHLREGKTLTAPAILAHFPLLAASQPLRQEAFSDDIRFAGENFLGAAVNISFAGSPPWRLLIVLPRKAVMAPYVQMTGWKILMTLILVALGVIWHAKRFLLPLRQITYAIQASAKEPWQVPAPLSQRTDEIGLLAKELDQLHRELTRRRQELEASSLLWRQTMDSLDLFVSVHDENYRIIKANRPLAQFFGHHPREIIGTTCYRLLHGTEAPHPRCGHSQTREKGIPVETEIHCQDRYFEVKTTPLKRPGQAFAATVHIMRDVTEKRARELALIESERQCRELSQRFHSLFNAVPDSILVLDEQLQILWANQAAADIIGRTPEEMTGFYCYFLLYGRSSPCDDMPCAAVRSLASGREEHQLKVGYAGRLQDIRVTPLKTEGGRVTEVISIARDITEMRKTEELLRESKKQEATVRLVAGIAHDFNNLVNIILGYTQILALRLDQAGAGRELTEIGKAVERMAALTKNLQAIVGRLKLTRKPEDLNLFLLKTKDLIAAELGPQTNLTLDLADAELIISADGDQLQLVLLNLAANAREAMPGGGLVSVKTKRLELLPAALRATGKQTGPWAGLVFADNGQGMDEETARLAAEPFFTTRPKTRAAGLGLPVAAGIVKQHGGIITWTSSPGRGTTLELFFPLLTEASSGELQNSTAAAAPATKAATILVAEDEATLRELAEEILTHAGFTVVTAADGREALELFEENPEKFDLLLLDVRMPRLGGIPVAQAAKKRRPEIRIVLLTGNVMDLPAETPGVTVMAKPFLPGELIKEIQKALS
jgi:PAS domain S-box-containing protein